MATLNSFLIKEYYDSNTAEQLVNLFTDGSNAGLSFLFSNKLKDVLKIEPSGNVPGTFNRHISRYYDDSKFLGRLSETYGMTHPNLDELAVLATDGKLLYPISEHNYLSDMVQRLDNDPVTVEALTKVLYNTGNNANPNYFKGSYLLTNLYNNPTTSGKIGVETLVYFKEQGGGDKGRKYTEISPLEDYIAKMTLTQKGRIVLPTMGDSQTYNTLYGTAINNFNQPLDTTNNKIKFNAKVLTRFINYFETELDTIEFNYKNEGNLTKEQKVKNYDTGNRNGYRFRYFNGFFKLKEQPTLGGIEFVDDFSDFNEALKLAEDVGGNDLALSVVNQIKAAWAKMSNSDKALLMNEYLIDAFKDELDYAKEIGIIDWNGRDFASVKSLALPQKALDDAENHYKKRQEVSKYSKELAATELMANYFANTISSVIEFEKLFIKDPAYYKDPVDKIKRLREVLSTGVTPRIDYGEGNELSNLTEVNVGTLSDNVIPSRQLDRINEFAKKSAAVRLLQEMHDMTQEEALAMYESGEVLPQDVEDAANLVVDSKFGGYTKVNQTDATVLISPEFYKELVRRIDGWTPEVAKAFDILNNPETDYEADADTYNEALAVTLKPLKLMYFGDHYDVNAKRDIPVFDKMAMFPVHRIFSTGDMGEVLKVMQARNIHMLAFESAVKVGQRVEEVKSKIYTDKSNTKIDVEGLMNMPTHKQSLVNFRRQLITDPHHADRQMFVSQAQKAAMGNIRTAWTYTTPNGVSYSGQEVIDNFNGAHNAITEFGRKSIEKDFGIDANNPQASIVKFANILKRKAENSNMNDNVLNGLTVEDGNTNAPISGLSDNSWIESGLISMLNKAIVDTNLPGGMFIQMSSILYNRLAVTSDANRVRKLNFVNNDGSMDCVISINLLKHIIPNYDKMTFSQAKAWLIKHDIIGPDTKAIAMGYRIPAQGQASTAALKVIDVYPEQIGDTITLPDEFTALTGSDFDIDKLFIARYNYDNNGNRIKFETKDQYVQRLRATGLDDETVVRKAYERYNGKTDFEANSREANENMLLDMYLSVISNPMNFAEARQPLDTVTDYLKDKILKDVDKLTGQGKRTSKSQLYFSTPAFQSRTKAELNGGKFGIGPFALANAHQVLTQLVKLNFKPNKVLNDYGIRDLHHIQSEDTNKINVLDWLSALINAHVDVAKDPYIIRLNVRKLTFNMTNFLIRSGKGESTFYFLPQQILKDYATEYDKYSGFYGVEIPAGKNPERLAFTKIWNDYYKKAKELSGGKKENLLNYLKDKGVGTNQRKTMFTVPHLRKQLQKTETFDWYYNQLLILKAYEELTPFSKSLSELTNLSQIDTKRFGNNFGLQSAFLDKWKQYMTEQAVFDNPLKVFTNTFLGKKMIDGLVFPRNAFQNVMIRLTPEFETLRSLIEYYTKGYAISDDTYINNITRAMEVSYKTKFFNQYVKDNQMGFRGMLFGKDSISRRLDRLKSDTLQGKYPSLLGSDGSFSNVLINNIFSRPKEDEAELQGPDFIAYKPNKSGDNNLENEIIRAWEELYESDYKEVREFAKDLAIYSFYTSGDAFGKNNIFRYVPNSIREEIGYFDYIRELEKHPENVISQIDLQEVIRNLWWNDHVVPAIEYYKLDSSYETIEEEGRAVYRPVAHDDSGLFVTNKKGEQVEIPSIIYDESSKFRGIVGYNEAGDPIHYLYKKVKLDKNNDPRTTFLYKYIGVDENKVPVYQLINKKGLSYKGNVLVEFGFKKSSVGYNNVVPTGLDFTPSKAITYVQDLTPVKASLQTKIFNQAGEFNENALQTVATENVDLQNTEPLSYQEWVKDYQTQKGEANAEAAYQQYLDNFEYNAKKQVPTKSRKTYTGMINSLEPNQIFVFGSNTQGRHGKGAALIAKNKFGAEYGNPEGPQGQSYAIITKDLTKRTHPSRTPEQIKEQIHNLYEYARENPDKEFLVAYSGTGQNLNAYSNQEMANMFSSEPIPDNIVFEQSFNELILTNQVSTVAKKPNTVPTTKIISGGQTGIDRLGLEIGRELGLETGGTTTPGYYTENGPDISLQEFGVTEIAPELQAGKKGKEFYLPRTEQNVINSDGTVYFSTDEDSAGRIATQRFAKAHNKPFLLNPTSQELAQWLVDNNINTLNVAGNRGSKVSPEFDSQVRETIRNAFKSPIQQNLFADEQSSETINMEVKPSETPTQFTELQQYANQVGLTETLPKVEEVKQAVEETKQIQDKYVYTFDDGLEVKLDFELNDQQKSALKELEAFVNGDDTSITLSGYAGTGKTTIMGIFNEYLKRRIQADIIFSAPTHRANAVTRQKTPNAKVVTLQSLLGLRPDFDITEDVFDLHKLKFEQVAEVKIEAASIVIVDEASMIQDSLYDFLLEQIAAKGAQIIFVGDKGQLRPVKANNISKVFRNDGAQLQLTKVERTGDNPILKESTRVRNGEGFSYETDIAPNGQGVEYSSDKTRIREFVKTSLKEMKDSQDPLYFRVLAATNSSVEAYNSAIRQILYGRRPAQLYEGELVMGYSNREYDSLRKKYKLMNSGDYVVQSVKPTTIQIDLTYPDRKESISMEGYKVTLKDAIDTSASSFTIDVVSNFETDENIIKVQEYIQTLWSMRKQLLAEGNPTAARSVVEKINRIQNKIHTMRDIKDANGRLKLRKSFDYGYAHTIHKSQGGTYSKVLINDSSINTFGFNDKNGQEVRQELKYVAVSRAKNYVMVQTLEKAKQQVVEDYDLDEEFVSATAADLKQAANDSATEELDKLGKQRKKECE